MNDQPADLAEPRDALLHERDARDEAAIKRPRPWRPAGDGEVPPHRATNTGDFGDELSALRNESGDA